MERPDAVQARQGDFNFGRSVPLAILDAFPIPDLDTIQAFR
jgi:hypothetical protein